MPLSKPERNVIQKALEQSQARLQNAKLARTSAKRSKAPAPAPDETADIICALRDALDAECKFLRGEITIAAAVKQSTRSCGCNKK